MSFQYEFLKRLAKMSEQGTREVSFDKIAESWPECRSYNDCLNMIESEYFDHSSNSKGTPPNSYYEYQLRITPRGMDWLGEHEATRQSIEEAKKANKEARNAKWASWISVLLSAISIAITVIFRFV